MPVLIACPSGGRDGFTDLKGPSSLSVRRVPSEALHAFLDPKRRVGFESRYGIVPKRERERLLYMLGLADAINQRDGQALRHAVESFVPDSGWLKPVWEEIARSPLGELRKELNSMISDTRFVVWWAEPERKLATGIYCGDISSALSALALSFIGQPGGLGACKRPQCHNLFIRLRSGRTQDYCGAACRVAAGMVRYRERKKRKAGRRR
jgi:hypothetical protein